MLPACHWEKAHASKPESQVLMLCIHGDEQKLRQKVHALKPEAQAEGIRVCCTKNPIPSARASGFLNFGFTQRNLKKRKLRGTAFVKPRHAFRRLAVRASRSSVLLSGMARCAAGPPSRRPEQPCRRTRWPREWEQSSRRPGHRREWQRTSLPSPWPTRA